MYIVIGTTCLCIGQTICDSDLRFVLKMPIKKLWSLYDYF